MQHEERFPNYFLIWIILLLLTGSSIVATLVVNEFAPALQTLLLVFLFVLGATKATLVAANFMHLRFESKVIWLLGFTALLFVGFFIAGTFLDITSTVKR